MKKKKLKKKLKKLKRELHEYRREHLAMTCFLASHNLLEDYIQKYLSEFSKDFFDDELPFQ